MAQTLEVMCVCGYRRPVHIGGLMQTWRERAYWPFHCATCGMVSVNIQAPLACPTCASPAVTPYGEAPVSVKQDCDFAYVQAWDYEACQYGHLCPACGQHDLKFERSRHFILSD